MELDVEDALDGHLRGRRVAGHEDTGAARHTLGIIDTRGLLPGHHPPLRLFPVNRLELQDVADGQELRRVATTGKEFLCQPCDVHVPN